MYVEDPRFRSNYNQKHAQLPEYFLEAIKITTNKKSKGFLFYFSAVFLQKISRWTGHCVFQGQIIDLINLFRSVWGNSRQALGRTS